MPSTKLIEFRLRRDTSYDRRYQNLVEQIKAENSTRFDEFTSAFLLYHLDSVHTLLSRLMQTTEIYVDGADMLFILDLSTMERAHIGVEQPDRLDFVLNAGAKAGFALGQQGNAIAQALMRPATRLS